MDGDGCAKQVAWSAITAAGADATLAGVLAGLLIAAVAALVVQWYQGSDQHTIALFGSGVPALMLSTYLFSVIAGVVSAQADYKSDLCSQMWSQWLLAISLLLIGSSILICGLGWALVSYGDNIAVKLCEGNFPITVVEDRRNFFIRLNAWLTASITTAATALLMVTNVTYLSAIGRKSWHFRRFHVEWYPLFFIYLAGLYLIGRSSYVVFIRTRSAMRANKKSCAGYAAGSAAVATDTADTKPLLGVGAAHPPVARENNLARRSEVIMRVAQEIAFLIWVALGALLAVYVTSGTAYDKPRWDAISPEIVIYIVVLYIVVRATYVLIVRTFERISPSHNGTPTGIGSASPTDAKSVERIRMRYSFGWLSPTTYSIVFLSVLGTFFVAVLTQAPLWTVARIVLSLLLGGLYPAGVLTGLSSSVPAAEDFGLSEREIARKLAFIR